MITTLLLSLLLQEADVDAWLRGDEKARERLLEAGPSAVRALRKSRERAPEKVDDLLVAIRAAGAPDLAKSLETRRSFEAKDLPVTELPGVLREALLTTVFVDLRLPDEAAVKSVTVAVADRPAHAVLDAVCRDAGLDWRLLYGVVLISTPDRLWPVAPRPKPAPLDGEALDKAKRLVEALNAETLEERDAASAALEKLGEAALPLLEAGAAREEKEIASRCKAVAAKLRVPPTRVAFGPPAAEREKGAEAAVRALKTQTIAMAISRLNVASCLKLLMGQTSTGLEIGALEGAAVSFRADTTSIWSLLCLLVHSCGADFIVRDGKVIVDKPEEIEKLLRR